MTASTYSAARLAALPYHDGYPPPEDLGLIGDGSTAALVARDGAVVWLCLPRFDSEPLFCSLLDVRRGGSFRIAPEDVTEARQRYEPDSGVLATELRSPSGLVRVTDCLTLRRGADLGEDVAAARGHYFDPSPCSTAPSACGSRSSLAAAQPRRGAAEVSVSVRLGARSST